MNKSIALGVLSLAILGVGAYGVSAFAAQGQNRTAGQFGPNYTPERHEQMQKAFENNDYNAWKSQMGNMGATRVVTEQNFSRFAEMHKLMLEGKTTEANAIRTELGLGQGGGKGMMGGQRGQNRGGNFVDANGDGKCDNMR
jgi:Spy/CpxP family protein refolding chaperone